VDTVVEVGGIWSFESSGLEAISNQYAAMPSLHIGWALWSALILGPRLKHKLAQLLAWVYPLLTLFAIVVTANHYWIDGLGGVAVVAIGFVLSKAYDQWANGTKFTSNPTPSDSGSGDLASTVGRGVA
jgi:membrane-associated phospholipid phosphatase